MTLALPAIPDPTSPAALEPIAREARTLLPVAPEDRPGLLRDEAALLLDRLLVRVARSTGALSLAIGEGLAALRSGDGPVRLGYSSVGDYAREILSIDARTAQSLSPQWSAGLLFVF